jgi:hypothetical protein
MKKTTIIAAIFKCARLAFGAENEILGGRAPDYNVFSGFGYRF